jgi:hypothetical protein
MKKRRPFTNVGERSKHNAPLQLSRAARHSRKKRPKTVPQ